MLKINLSEKKAKATESTDAETLVSDSGKEKKSSGFAEGTQICS